VSGIFADCYFILCGGWFYGFSVANHFDVGESLTAGSLEDEDVHSETAVCSLEQENPGNGNDEVIMVMRITIECLYFYLVVVQLLKL
jgi:hypothetical protein